MLEFVNVTQAAPGCCCRENPAGGALKILMDFFFPFRRTGEGNQHGANGQTLPVNKVVFVEVQKPRGNIARHSLQEQRVRGLGVALSTAVQVALRVTLGQEGTGCSGCF